MKNTPWGPSQDQTTLVDGIVFHSTTSHGGIELNTCRRLALMEQFPSWQDRWFEEDCEVCIVVLAFADEFEDDRLISAINMARAVATWPHSDSRWIDVAEWIDKQPKLLERAGLEPLPPKPPAKPVNRYYDQYEYMSVSDADPGL